MVDEHDDGPSLVRLWGQAPAPTVSELLQAILAELRGLRHDLQGHTVVRRKGGSPRGPSWPGREARRFLREVLEAHPEGLPWTVIAEKGEAIELAEVTLRRARPEVAELRIVERKRLWFLREP